MLTEPIAGSINIHQRNRAQVIQVTEIKSWIVVRPEHGVFVHNLALTFSTLLSSQVSGAHLADSFEFRLGQLAKHYCHFLSESNRAFCQSQPTAIPAIFAGHMWWTQTIDLMSCWGSAPDGRSEFPRRVPLSGGSEEHYACVTARSNPGDVAVLTRLTPGRIDRRECHCSLRSTVLRSKCSCSHGALASQDDQSGRAADRLDQPRLGVGNLHVVEVGAAFGDGPSGR